MLPWSYNMESNFSVCLNWFVWFIFGYSIAVILTFHWYNKVFFLSFRCSKRLLRFEFLMTFCIDALHWLPENNQACAFNELDVKKIYTTYMREMQVGSLLPNAEFITHWNKLWEGHRGHVTLHNLLLSSWSWGYIWCHDNRFYSLQNLPLIHTYTHSKTHL